MRFLGVVVLYFPDENWEENIMTYASEVDQLLLVDNSNSTGSAYTRLKNEKRLDVRYLPNEKNEGMARALNLAAAYGLENGFDWMLAMDQDSAFQSGHFRRMLEYVRTNKDGRTGMIAPLRHRPHQSAHRATQSISKIRFTMTSGSMLRLTAYTACGPFDEKLFIDSVDHEYCLRLRENGFLIEQCNFSILKHRPGSPIHLAGWTAGVSHPAFRKYFQWRNRLYVMFRYFRVDPVFFLIQLKEMAKDIIKVCFFESDKTEKLRAISRGTWHFVQNKYPHP